MGFFSLIGRLMLNTRPFEQGLGHAEKKASSFADRVEHKVGKKLDKAFGVGLVTGAVIGQVHEFFDLFKGAPEHAKHVGELMDKTKLTAESVQALEEAAKQAGQPWEEFIKSVQDTGGIDATIARIRELRKHTLLSGEEVENLRGGQDYWQSFKDRITKGVASGYTSFIDNLTVAMRRVQMWSEGNFSGAESGSLDDLAEQKRQDELNRAQAEKDDDARLREMLSPQAKGTGSIDRSQSGPVTAWQSIGAYVGVSGDVMLREQQQTNEILRRLEHLSREQISALNRQGQLFL